MTTEDPSIVSFKPKCVPDKWTGEIKLKLLDFDQHFAALASVRAAQDRGEGYYRQANKDLGKHVVAVDLVRTKDGKAFKSLADLAYGNDCHTIICEALDYLLGQGDEDQGNG